MRKKFHTFYVVIQLNVFIICNCITVARYQDYRYTPVPGTMYQPDSVYVPISILMYHWYQVGATHLFSYNHQLVDGFTYGKWYQVYKKGTYPFQFVIDILLIKLSAFTNFQSLHCLVTIVLYSF